MVRNLAEIVPARALDRKRRPYFLLLRRTTEDRFMFSPSGIWSLLRVPHPSPSSGCCWGVYLAIDGVLGVLGI